MEQMELHVNSISKTPAWIKEKHVGDRTSIYATHQVPPQTYVHVDFESKASDFLILVDEPNLIFKRQGLLLVYALSTRRQAERQGGSGQPPVFHERSLSVKDKEKIVFTASASPKGQADERFIYHFYPFKKGRHQTFQSQSKRRNLYGRKALAQSSSSHPGNCEELQSCNLENGEAGTASGALPCRERKRLSHQMLQKLS